MAKRADKKAAKNKWHLDHEQLKFTEHYVVTPEDWHPSFYFDKTTKEYECTPREWRDAATDSQQDFMFTWFYFRLSKTVVTLSEITFNYEVRGACWSGDDTYMVTPRTYFETFEEAEREFERWSKWLSNVGMVMKESLKQIGFEYD